MLYNIIIKKIMFVNRGVEVAYMKARDIMIKEVLKVKDDSTVKNVLEIFSTHKISGLPVVNDRNETIGYISDGDIMRWIGKKEPVFIDLFFVNAVFLDQESLESKFDRLVMANVMDVAKKKIIVVEEDEEIEKVATILGNKKIKKVPVHRNGVLRGIISRGDIIRYVTKEFLKN